MPKLSLRNILSRKKHQHRCTDKSTENQRLLYQIPFPILVSLMLIEVTSADWLMECGSCHCKWNSGKKTADCKNLSLYLVPSILSSEVQVLDLSFNQIEHLEPHVFIKSNLQNLHKLYIRNASLYSFDPRSFSDLKILIELDLSNNFLRSLQANQFHHLVKVRAILLNFNLLESLPDGLFRDLNYLHRIELRGNRITHVAMHVFVNLPKLSQIYLDENRLSFMRKETFENLKRLTALSLDHNPWNCTCELKIFREFVIHRNLYTPPTSCYYPVRLRGTLWTEDHNEAFVCKPKILYPARGATINSSKENATMICRVHASPNTQITWNHKKRSLRIAPGFSSNRFQIKLQHDEHDAQHKSFGRNVLTSRLTIFGVDKSDEGIYTCLAENAAGKDSVQMNLLIDDRVSNDFWIIQENVVVVISIIALALLGLFFFLSLAAFCVYKYFKLHKDSTRRQGQPDDFSHLNTELKAADEAIAELSPNDSDMIVCRTKACVMDNGQKTKTKSGFQYMPNENTLSSGDETFKIFASSVFEDGSYLIAHTRKEKTMFVHTQTRDVTNVIVSNNLAVPQKQRWPSRNNSKISKENSDFQKEHSTADFRPDLLATYTKDVKR